jgi:superfamily II DNA or RNA helicase
LQQNAPDWSWQNNAVNAALAALQRSRSARVGLIVPTGGGKTRVALKTALKLLEQHPGKIIWVTHRQHLERQARRTLLALVREKSLPQEDVAKTLERFRFVMTTRLAEELRDFHEELICFIVDEAHHAAAATYRPLLMQDVAPVLMLTATPNRVDTLPIGITEIAYQTTYRELFERGCLIEPIFDAPEDMPGLDWSSPEGLYALADYLLDRTETDFVKPLVAVSQRERAAVLYAAVVERLEARDDHPLTLDDIGYVHGGANSRMLSDSSDFLDEFSSRPAGILIATSQLVGEGFDDPSIDAAILTYPSTSIAHLMQVAGRALRFAPGKTRSHVIQVRQSALEYYFDQRWLYQDISDQLRPDLMDCKYASIADLLHKAKNILLDHRVAEAQQNDIISRLAETAMGNEIHVLLSGLPYFGSPDTFDNSANWRALLVNAEERFRFLNIYNDISSRTEDLKEQNQYLKAKLGSPPSPANLMRSYSQLIPAMEYARREINHLPYSGATNRPYRKGRATTWLKYVTFTFEPVVPQKLENLFADAFNREQLLNKYTEAPQMWALALRLELPVSGSEGFLLTSSQAGWFNANLKGLMERLGEIPRGQVFEEFGGWRESLDIVLVPQRIISHIDQFLRPERLSAHLLMLHQNDIVGEKPT